MPWHVNVTNAPNDAGAARSASAFAVANADTIRHDIARRKHRVARRYVVGPVAALLVVAFVAPAFAQVNPFRVQQRYKEASSGKSIDDYTKRLNDPDPATRLEAVKSLGESGKDEAVEYLIQATGDPDQSVMIKAIDYLGKLRATAATQILVQKLFMRDVPLPVQQRILV
jgi:HEAT repeat protein